MGRLSPSLKAIWYFRLRQTFRNDFIAALMVKLRYLSDRIHYLSSYDLEERFRIFLQEHFGEQQVIDCSLSKKDVAAALGATPESLSRLLHGLRREELVVWEQNRIKVSDEFWGRPDLRG